MKAIRPLSFLFVCIAHLSVTALAEEWKPLDPAHLSMPAPVVEKDADAEAIFWELHIKDEMIKDELRNAEISDLRIESPAAPDQPFVCAYHLRVPGYARRAGDRLTVQPAFFQKGLGAIFQATERKNAVFFPHPWAEQDVVTIELPHGFESDNIESPAPLTISNFSKYVAVMTAEKTRLTYRRDFYFGAGGLLIILPPNYNQIRTAFLMIHDRDNQMLVINRRPTSPN